ncbi:MAG: hypothetical protein Q9169_008479, partial [Polycauliona sp. 2 TL-2023]
MVSPANRVRNLFARNNQPAPSSQEINDRYVPPLSRWSDVTWTIWKELSDNDPNLRFIGHDSVINTQTNGIMDYIFEKYAYQDSDDDDADADAGDEYEWPGLDF